MSHCSIRKAPCYSATCPVCLAIPIDGRAHVVQEQPLPDSSGNREPAIFVARRLGGGGVLLLGRSLWETYDLQRTLLRALAIAILPTILAILAIGAFFARRASQRFERVHDAIVRFMDGDLDSRLPAADEGGDIDKCPTRSISCSTKSRGCSTS